MTYITTDLKPRRLDDLIEGLLASSGEHPEYGPDAADVESLVKYIEELQIWRDEVVKPAVSGLIEVHIDTGIDLKNWGPVLNLVQSVEPTFSIEGEEEW